MPSRLAPAILAALAIVATIASIRPWEPPFQGPFPIEFLNWDLLCEYIPHLGFLARTVRSGRIPLWNPEELCGYPFLAAAQTGVLYPPHAAYVLRPRLSTLAALHAIHMVIAGLGVWLLARRLGASRGAALLSSIMASLAPPMLMGAFQVPRDGTLAWAGLCFAAIEARTRRAATLGLALPFAMALLAGYLPYGFFLGLAVLLASAGRSLQRRESALLARTLAGLAGGVLLAGAVLLPAIELMGQSTRTAGLDDATRTQDALTGGDLLALLTGEVRGSLPWLLVGTTGLCGALGALLTPRARPYLLVAALGVAYAMGHATPIYELLGRLPLAGSFRGVRAAIPLVHVPLAVVASLGVSRLTQLAVRGRAAMAALLGIGGIVALVLGGHLLAIETLMAAAILAASPRSLPVALAAVLAVRLLALTPSLPPWAHRYGPILTPPAEAEKQWREIHPARVASNLGTMMPHTPSAVALDAASGPVSIVRASGHPPSLHLRSMTSLLETLRPGPMGTIADPGPFSLLASPYLVADARFRSERFPRAGFSAIDEALGLMGVALFRNPIALPRAYPIRNRGFARDARVKLVRLDANEVELRLEGGAGAVVLLETYYPGWRAWADGRLCPVTTAHGAFRAIASPRGTRQILLRFEPLSFRLGLFVSLVALAAAAVTIGASWGR